MEHCRSCGADVIWVVTTNGKRMPVDAKPSDIGNLTLHPVEDEGPPVAMYHTTRLSGTSYYISHFATCPQSKRWKKKHGAA